MCIRHQDKVTTAAGPCCIYIFYNREQEREAKAQEREKRKETRQAQMLAALQRSPMTNPESLKDKAQIVFRHCKCLIDREAGHGAKECPNYGKSPKKTCFKSHQLGSTLPLKLKSPQG